MTKLRYVSFNNGNLIRELCIEGIEAGFLWDFLLNQQIILSLIDNVLVLMQVNFTFNLLCKNVGRYKYLLTKF